MTGSREGDTAALLARLPLRRGEAGCGDRGRRARRSSRGGAGLLAAPGGSFATRAGGRIPPSFRRQPSALSSLRPAGSHGSEQRAAAALEAGAGAERPAGGAHPPGLPVAGGRHRGGAQ